jgi:hypothetical protein
MKIDILSEQHWGEYGGDPYESRVYVEGIEVADINELVSVCKDFCNRQLSDYDPRFSERGFDVYRMDDSGTKTKIADIWLLTKSISLYFDQI